MSFLFKSSKKGSSQTTNTLPPVSRDIRSSDGPQSQIPTLNGAPNGAKPGSPPPVASASGSLNSLASEKLGMRSPPPGDSRAAPGDLTSGQMVPSSEQRARNMSQDEVSGRQDAEDIARSTRLTPSCCRHLDLDPYRAERRLQTSRLTTRLHTLGRSAS